MPNQKLKNSVEQNANDDRLASLSRYGILDTVPEQGFDDMVSLATQLCGTPVALVSLVDRDRQWFKARLGFEPCETDLNSSVCRHALGRTEILEIEDLTLDRRTASNPLVTNTPHIRFYAGAPLTTLDGQTLGTLCVIDLVPRPGGLTSAQRSGLTALANQVMAQLELRRAVAEREASIAGRQAEQRLALAEAARLEAMIATQQAVAVVGVDLKVAFRAIVEAALRIIDAGDGAVVQLRDGEELVYEVAAGSSNRHVGHRLPLEGTLSGRALRREMPMMCNDTEVDVGINHHLTRALDIRSMIVAPITRHGAPIGALKVKSANAGAFAARDVVMVQMLAGLLGSAVGDMNEARSTQALKAAETRYRQTFESVTEFGVIVMDRDGKITEWNTGAEHIFGWSAEEMRGSDASRFYTPEDREIDRARTEMRRSLLEGSAVDERWHLRKDGSRFYASGNVMPLRGDQDEHLGFIKIVRDRTEQHLDGKRLEESQAALAQSEAKWRGLFQNLQEGFIVGRVLRDKAGQITDWIYEEVNEAWGELVGIPAGSAAGKTIRGLFPGIEDQWVMEFAQVVETGEAIRFTRQVGTIGRWYDGICQPIEGDRFTAIFLEVTARVLADRRREALRELGDALMEAETPDEMARIAAGIVGRALDVGRVGYGTVAEDGETFTVPNDWTAEGYPTLAGIYRMDDYGGYTEELRQGHTVVIPDIRLDARTAGNTRPLENLAVRSLVNLPIVERGRTVAILYVNTDEPRQWTTEETAFLRDVAQRTRAAVARVQAEEHQAILNAELAHRLKNNLALVQSIVSQTLRSAVDLPTARSTLAQRIRALAKAHDVLMSGSREASSVQDIVRSTASLLDEGGRVEAKGPHIELGSSATLSLVLICHELATNAVKYGALSVESGYVQVNWRIEEQLQGVALFIFEWLEFGGPRVTPPIRNGFGTRLIEAGLSGTAAKVEIDYAVEGVRCRVEGLLSELQSSDETV